MSQESGKERPSWKGQFAMSDMQFVRGTTSLSTQPRGGSDQCGNIQMGTPVLDESVHDTPVVCDNSSETKQDEATSGLCVHVGHHRRSLAGPDRASPLVVYSNPGANVFIVS